MARNKLSATDARNLRTLLLLDVFAPEEIGARIAKAREEAGLRQEDLADLVELSTRQVQNLEAGVSKPYKHLKAIAEVTNRPFDWFLHGDEEKPQLPPGLQEQLADAVEALAEVAPRLAAVADRLEALLVEQPQAPASDKPG